MNLTCHECGKFIETLPVQCSYSININNNTNQWDCYMENCGYVSLDNFICEICCTNRNILKINKKIERLSFESVEFRNELSFFKNNSVQINLANSDFSFWILFGNSEYKSGVGKIDNPSISIFSSQKTISHIFRGTIEPINGLLSNDLKLKGDIQYGIAFFDLIKLGLEIIKEQKVKYVQ